MTFFLKMLGVLLVGGGLIVAQYDPSVPGNLVPGYFEGRSLDRLLIGALLIAFGVGVWMLSIFRDAKGK